MVTKAMKKKAFKQLLKSIDEARAMKRGRGECGGGFRMTTPKAKCGICKKPITQKRGWHGDSDGRYEHMDCRMKWLYGLSAASAAPKKKHRHRYEEFDREWPGGYYCKCGKRKP